MLSFSMPELILILVIALVVFGPSKLPEVGKAIGLSLHEFKKATSEEEKKSIPTSSTNMEVKKPE